MKKFIKIVVVIFVVWFLVLFVKNLKTETHNQKESSNTKTEQVSKKKSKKADNSKANKAIADSLKEDQDFANKGNKDYNWATYINSMKYNDGIDISVNGDFNQLTSDQKKDVISSAQSCADSALLDSKVINQDECTDGLFVTVYYGQKSIGRSKALDKKQFVFDK